MIKGESSFTKIKSHLRREEWDRVIEICQAEIAADPSSIDFYPYLAKAYAQQDKLNLAVSAYKKTLGTAIDQAEIYAELGILYSKQQEPDRAIWHYQQALKLKPDWAELQYNLAVVLHQRGRWSEAIATYIRAIELRPDYSAAYFNLGVLYDRQGDLDAAVASYQQVIAIQPQLVRAYSNLGSALARQENYDQAIAVFQQGLALDPTWGTLHNNLGQVYWFARQPELALSSFETAIILEPKMALAHHNLGRLWQQQGNFARALNCFRQAIELEPDNVLAYSIYGDAQLQAGNLEETLASWRKIVELEPDFVDAYYQRKLSDSPEDLLEIAKLACARFLQSLKQDRQKEVYHHLWRTYSYMGDVLFDYGGIKAAEVYYQRALQIEPEDIELYLKLGNCLARQHRLNAAAMVYQRGLHLQPEQPQINFQLGKVLERTQQAEQAIDCYENVLTAQSGASEWKQLPKLFPTEENIASLPKQIYHHTQDWVRDCSLENFDYLQIAWATDSTFNQAERTRAAQIIEVHPGDTAYLDCGGVNCNRCMSRLIEQFQPVQLGLNAYHCTSETTPQIEEKLPFVVTIPEGRAWSAAKQNSWVICDALAVITPDNYLLGDLSRYYPWFLPGCPYQERNEHSIFERENIAPVEKIAGKVALLTGLAGHVYYHWMFDILPRLELLRRSEIKFTEIDWFAINNIDKPFQQETLELLGIDLERVIVTDRHTHIQADELIAPSFPGYLDWVPHATIEFLRQAFLPQVDLSSTEKLKIYVSRAKAKNRQLVNEREVDQLLNKRGFTTVFLEEMSFLEQVELFANAQIVVAPHGSGLTNLVFCSPRTKVVELFSPNYTRTDYIIIGQQLQLDYYYVVGTNFNCASLRNLMYQNPLTEDILVNIDALKLVLQHCQA